MGSSGCDIEMNKNQLKLIDYVVYTFFFISWLRNNIMWYVWYHIQWKARLSYCMLVCIMRKLISCIIETNHNFLYRRKRCVSVIEDCYWICFFTYGHTKNSVLLASLFILVNKYISSQYSGIFQQINKLSRGPVFPGWRLCLVLQSSNSWVLTTSSMGLIFFKLCQVNQSMRR